MNRIQFFLNVHGTELAQIYRKGLTLLQVQSLVLGICDKYKKKTAIYSLLDAVADHIEHIPGKSN